HSPSHFSFLDSTHHTDSHPFPTRRSSDLEKVYYEANQIAADKLGMDYSLAYYKQFIGAGTDAMRAQMIEDYSGDAQLIYDFLRRSEEHTSELQSRFDLVCRLLLEQKKDTG